MVKDQEEKESLESVIYIDPYTCFFPLYVLPKIVLLVDPNNLQTMSRVNPDPVMSSIHTWWQALAWAICRSLLSPLQPASPFARPPPSLSVCHPWLVGFVHTYSTISIGSIDIWMDR